MNESDEVISLRQAAIKAMRDEMMPDHPEFLPLSTREQALADANAALQCERDEEFRALYRLLIEAYRARDAWIDSQQVTLERALRAESEAQALEAVYETAREYEELVEAGVHHRDYSNAFARLQAAIDAVLSIRETRPR